VDPDGQVVSDPEMPRGCTLFVWPFVFYALSNERCTQ